jgi:hypothetical protein
MKKHSNQLLWILGFTLSCSIVLLQAAGQEMGKQKDEAAVKSMVANWPDSAKQAALATMQEYGPPHEATESMLAWNNTGEFKRTIVYKQEIQHNFPTPHKDVLEQFISYQVPPDKFDELAKYDGSVVLERTKGEISARCDKEPLNRLALNLANDIVTGKKSVDEARKFYADTAKKFLQGEKPEYTKKLFFSPKTMAGDPDKPAMPEKREMSKR